MKNRGSWIKRWIAGDSFARDAILLVLFAAVIAWSLFFTVVRPGASPAGAKAGASTADWKGTLTIRVTGLPESAWHNVQEGDRMGTAAVVTGTAVKEYSTGRKELHITLKVSGPLQFTTVRYPFPQMNLALRVGSLVWFETDRYTLMGDVIAKTP